MFDSPQFQGMQNRFMDRLFQKVDGVVWDLMSGGLGVLNDDCTEVMSLSGQGDDAQVSVNLFADFSVPLPAFAQSTPEAGLAVGDLIYANGKVLGWIIETPNAGKRLKLLRPSGTTTTWKPPAVQAMGAPMEGAMVVRSLFNMFGNNLGGLQSNLLPLLAMGGSSADLEGMMLPMLMMSQGGNGMFGMGQTPASTSAVAPQVIPAKPAVYAREEDGVTLKLDSQGDPIVLEPAVPEQIIQPAPAPVNNMGNMGNMMQTMMMMKMMKGLGGDKEMRPNTSSSNGGGGRNQIFNRSY